jgi:DNA invertase Pin-like site-specific DNA recombinase
MREKPRAALYTRVSTDDQAHGGVSLEAQERTLRERASADGAEVAAHFQDVLSGARTDRPEYVRMLAAATAGDVEIVYVWKYDRLGRDAEELLRARRMLGAAGVRIVSATEGEAESTLLYGVHAIMGQVEREKIAERTAMGLREVGRSGRWRGGLPPIGYRLVDGKLVIVPTEAAIVRRIYAEYLAGKGQNRIAAALNTDGIRTRPSKLYPDGSRFVPRCVIETLQNRTYLGEIASKGETLCADAHEPIIDRETFDRAQRLRVSKTSSPTGGGGRPAKRHLLDGLLRCPNGHRMLARINRSNEWEHYRCCERHSGGICPTPAVSRVKVDTTLLSHFLNRHWDEKAERERLLEAARAKGAEARDLAVQADREEQEAEAALVRVRRDYQRGAISAEEWHEFRTELEEEAEASRRRASQLRVRAAQLDAEAAHVDAETQLGARLAAILRAAAGDLDDPRAVAEFRAALASTFESVTFHPGWTDDVPAGSPLVLGETQLVPVIRPDLVVSEKASHASESEAGSPPPS